MTERESDRLLRIFTGMSFVGIGVGGMCCICAFTVLQPPSEPSLGLRLAGVLCLLCSIQQALDQRAFAREFRALGPSPDKQARSRFVQDWRELFRRRGRGLAFAPVLVLMELFFQGTAYLAAGYLICVLYLLAGTAMQRSVQRRLTAA